LVRTIGEIGWRKLHHGVVGGRMREIRNRGVQAGIFVGDVCGLRAESDRVLRRGNWLK